MDLEVFFKQKLLRTLGCVMILSQSSGALEGYRAKFMSCSYLFMEKHWKFPLRTKIAHDLRMCHNFVSRLVGHVQGRKSTKFLSGLRLSYGEILKVLTANKFFLWFGEVAWFKYSLWKLNVFKRKRLDFIFLYTFLMENHKKFLLNIRIAYELRMCHYFVPRSVVNVQSQCFKRKKCVNPF